MDNVSKFLIKEDVEFINDYIRELKKETRKLVLDDEKTAELIIKIERRLKDIESRVEA